MSKFFTVAFIAAFLTVNISSAQAKPTRGGCASISKVQYTKARNLPAQSSKTALDKMLGTSCQISGYGKGLSAYGYKLSYDSKNWFVVVYRNGKVYKSAVLPVGRGLREG